MKRLLCFMCMISWPMVHAWDLEKKEGVLWKVKIKTKAGLALEEIPLGELVSLELKSQGEEAILTGLDLRMPEHGHGMVVVPKIKSHGSGSSSWTVEGIKCHMPGKWVLYLKAKKGSSLIKWEKEIFVKA